MLIDAIRSDPEYREGRYETQPAALGAVWNLFNLMADSDFHLEKAIPNIASADQTVSQRRQTALTSEDANNLIYQFEASQDYDPEPALGNIRAAMIAVNFADDVLNPPELGTLARLISKVPRGRAVTIPVGPESHGHLTLQESALWGPQVTILFQSMDEA